MHPRITALLRQSCCFPRVLSPLPSISDSAKQAASFWQRRESRIDLSIKAFQHGDRLLGTCTLHFFYTGILLVLKILDRMGQALESTPVHRIQAFGDEVASILA